MVGERKFSCLQCLHEVFVCRHIHAGWEESGFLCCSVVVVAEGSLKLVLFYNS